MNEYTRTLSPGRTEMRYLPEKSVIVPRLLFCIAMLTPTIGVPPVSVTWPVISLEVSAEIKIIDPNRNTKLKRSVFMVFELSSTFTKKMHSKT